MPLLLLSVISPSLSGEHAILPTGLKDCSPVLFLIRKMAGHHPEGASGTDIYSIALCKDPHLSAASAIRKWRVHTPHFAIPFKKKWYSPRAYEV